MSLKYRDSQGNETPVAGLNGKSGELVPSVALKQSGSVKNTSTISQTLSYQTINLATPMPDTDYVVNVESTLAICVEVYNKTTTSFTLALFAPQEYGTITIDTVRFSWTAFKLMTDTVHEADSAHISQNTANFASAFSEVTSYAVGDYVTYNNILYRCTTAHTAGVWVAGHFTQVTVGSTLGEIVPKAFKSNTAHIVATLPNNSLYRVTVDKHGQNTEMGVFLIGIYDTTSITLLKEAESTAGKFTIRHTAANTVEITDTDGGHIWAKFEYLGDYY